MDARRRAVVLYQDSLVLIDGESDLMIRLSIGHVDVSNHVAYSLHHLLLPCRRVQIYSGINAWLHLV